MNIYDISKKSGVSIATVSRVINGSSRVRPETRSRILAVMQEMGYAPSRAASMLGGGASKTVGILAASTADPFLAEGVALTERQLLESGYDSILICTGYAQDERERAMKLLSVRSVDGVICIGSDFVSKDPAQQAYLKETAEKLPLLLVNGYLPGSGAVCAYADEENAMKAAAVRLLQTHKRVLYLSVSDSSSARRKERGYDAALEASGIKKRAELKLRLTGDLNAMTQQIADRLTGGLVFDAVLAEQDAAALAAFKALRRRKIKVPKEVEIIGCNNSLLARACEPELTSIDNHLETLCREGTAALLALLTDMKAEVNRTICIPADLVERSSTK